MADWTEDRVGQLIALFDEGFSFSCIAEKLGGVSRSAVAAKLDRLGLKRSAARHVTLPKVRPKKKTPRPHPGNIARKAASRKTDPGIVPDSTVSHGRTNPLGPPWARQARARKQAGRLPAMSDAPPGGSPVRFADLACGQCRWPLGDARDPAGPEMPCCGADVVNRDAVPGRREASHCAYHLKVSKGIKA